MKRLALCVLLLAAQAARAERMPSADLRFKVALAPDSITVGDPITLTVEADAPRGGSLLLPQFQDSIGPFVVLGQTPPERAEASGRVTLRDEVKVTLFRTGVHTLPPLTLLWERAPGETLVATSTEASVTVGSLLVAGSADPSKLHGVKGVVSLHPSRAWIYILAGALLAAAGYLLFRRMRSGAPSLVAPPKPPAEPPEITFDRGCDALLAAGLLDRGELKEFYVRLSQLLRRYLEDSFGFPAVEATRDEVLDSMAARGLPREERIWLGNWLGAGDLVKFARGERLLAEAKEDVGAARDWVKKLAEAERLKRRPALEEARP